MFIHQVDLKVFELDAYQCTKNSKQVEDLYVMCVEGEYE